MSLNLKKLEWVISFPAVVVDEPMPDVRYDSINSSVENDAPMILSGGGEPCFKNELAIKEIQK